MRIKRSKAEASKTLIERRAEADAKARATIDTLARATATHQAQAMLSALSRIMIRGRQFVLDTLADVMLAQVWAVDAQGDLIGHVLTIDDTSLMSAHEIVVLTIADALDDGWCDPAERGSWRSAYSAALRSIANDAEAIELALVERDILCAVPGRSSSDGGPPDPRRKGRPRGGM